MEAGIRCYDDRVPEEVYRRIIDHTSSILLPYTYRSKENLVREGIERDRIFVIGNPIKEVMDHNLINIEKSNVLERLKIIKGHYFMVTLHRSENVDEPKRLEMIITSL